MFGWDLSVETYNMKCMCTPRLSKLKFDLILLTSQIRRRKTYIKQRMDLNPISCAPYNHNKRKLGCQCICPLEVDDGL